jgi:protein SCO1/2
MHCEQQIKAETSYSARAVYANARSVALAFCKMFAMVPLVAFVLAPSVTLAAAEAVETHAHHHMAAVPYARTVVNYQVPDVTLVRADGNQVQLSKEIDDGRPVVLSFIYTSCTTVCPMTSATLSELQEKLDSARDLVHMMSISIDPEFDTPARLRDYAARFGAGPEWQYYTGTLAASQKSQRAFDVYRGNKMEHLPVTLLRTKPGMPWVRIDGFATADQLLAELPLSTRSN